MYLHSQLPSIHQEPNQLLWPLTTNEISLACLHRNVYTEPQNVILLRSVTTSDTSRRLAVLSWWKTRNRNWQLYTLSNIPSAKGAMAKNVAPGLFCIATHIPEVHSSSSMKGNDIVGKGVDVPKIKKPRDNNGRQGSLGGRSRLKHNSLLTKRGISDALYR